MSKNRSFSGHFLGRHAQGYAAPSASMLVITEYNSLYGYMTNG